jgi:hypothetical protein
MTTKAAGFKSVSVQAIGDGSYVWGRVGFRPREAYSYQNLAEKMEEQIQNFRAGRSSVVLNEAQAALIGILVQRARDSQFSPESAPGSGDYLMMLDSPDLNPGVEMGFRATNLMNWFRSQAPFGSGVFTYGEGNVLDDPRYPEGRRR